MTGQVRNIVVAGKSGAGKQPRIDVLVDELGLVQLSTGNIFRSYLGAWKKLADKVDMTGCYGEGGFASDERLRERVSAPSHEAGVDPEAAMLGFKAACFVDQGLFVPDDITNALLEAAVRELQAGRGGGMVLDGYPRTPDQSRFLLALAETLGTPIDLVLMVDNEDEAIVSRTLGRRICPSCAKVFHLEFKPPRDGRFCTACGVEVICRSDDTEERIRTRLAEFRSKALPAIAVLQDAGIPVVNVPGNLPVFTDEAVRESVLGAIAAR